MKRNKSGFRPPLCTYRLNWAKWTSWGWWDEWDDTVLQTQDSKFEPRGLRPSTLPLGHGGSPQYWLPHVDGEETFFVSFKLPRPGTKPRTLAWKAAVLATTLGPPPTNWRMSCVWIRYSHVRRTQHVRSAIVAHVARTQLIRSYTLSSKFNVGNVATFIVSHSGFHIILRKTWF